MTTRAGEQDSHQTPPLPCANLAPTNGGQWDFQEAAETLEPTSAKTCVTAGSMQTEVVRQELQKSEQ